MISKCPHRVLALGQESNLNEKIAYFPTPRNNEEIDHLDEHHENEEIEEQSIGLNVVHLHPFHTHI